VKLVKNKIVIVTIVISVLLNALFSVYLFDDYLYIYFLNVGQGDSILIRTPDHKYLLVDAGPDEQVISELGKVMPFWKKKIDYMILTHPDADHVGGMIDVIKNYKIDNLIYTGYPTETSVYQEFLKLVTLKQINQIKLGSTIDFYAGCCVVVDMLWPDINNISEIEETNNASQAFILRFKEFRAYFGGDMDSNYEDIVARRNSENIDLLKIGHHGSKYSTSEFFLKTLDPEVAVIEAGKDNTYGHPHKEVISRLKNAEIEVFINYEYEKLYFKTDGSYLAYYTH
jgi:competence protein ComEC